jgi:hypothetical protein
MMKSHRKDVLVGLFFLILPHAIPVFALSEVNTLVGATSAVFAIVAGFFIADAMSNYLRLQTLISEENAALISLADNTKKIDPGNYAKVHQAIDTYMIAQLDYGNMNHILHTQDEIEGISKAVEGLAIGPEDAIAYDHVLGIQEKILSSRQEISLAAKKNLTFGHWFVLCTLAGLVVVTVLAIRDGNLLLNVITGIMIAGVWSILVLLRDMDNNRLLEEKLAYENPREVFYAISKPPYYPLFSPSGARIPNEAGMYRIGSEVVQSEGGADMRSKPDSIEYR